MQITIADRCFKLFNSWLTQSYSPNLTNADKILSNLKRIGHNDREVWANSFDIICNALKLFDLTLVHALAIENLRLTKDGHLIIDTSFTMLNPDEEPQYSSFALDCTLNLLEEAKEEEVIPEFRLDSLLFNQKTNIKNNDVPFTEEIVMIQTVPLSANNVEHRQDVSLPPEGIENVQPAIHPNVKANVNNTSLSKSYHSLPFFPELVKPAVTAASSVNDDLAEQIIRPSSPGLIL